MRHFILPILLSLFIFNSNAQENKHSLGLHFGPNKSHVTNGYNFKGAISYEGGVEYNYHLSRRITLSTGLNYNRQNKDISYYYPHAYGAYFSSYLIKDRIGLPATFRFHLIAQPNAKLSILSSVEILNTLRKREKPYYSTSDADIFTHSLSKNNRHDYTLQLGLEYLRSINEQYYYSATFKTGYYTPIKNNVTPPAYKLTTATTIQVGIGRKL